MKSIAAKTGNSHGLALVVILRFMCVWTEYCRDGHGLRCLCWMHSFRSYHVASLIPRKDVGCGFVVEVQGSWKALITRCKQLWYHSRGRWDRFQVFLLWGCMIGVRNVRKRRDLIIVLWFVLTVYLRSLFNVFKCMFMLYDQYVCGVLDWCS